MSKQICVITEDLSSESSDDRFRAFWTGSLDSDVMCPVWGYCTAGHTFLSVERCLADLLKGYPDAEVWRYFAPPRYGDRPPERLRVPSDKYVECDWIACAALQEPSSPEEVATAYEHWKDHSYLCGCSHGR